MPHVLSHFCLVHVWSNRLFLTVFPCPVRLSSLLVSYADRSSVPYVTHSGRVSCPTFHSPFSLRFVNGTERGVNEEKWRER